MHAIKQVPGVTPLLAAVSGNDAAAVALLLDSGADPLKKIDFLHPKFNLLHAALRTSTNDVVRELVKPRGGPGAAEVGLGFCFVQRFVQQTVCVYRVETYFNS
jgi:hypothetical protein